jgi:hypothetical protein
MTDKWHSMIRNSKVNIAEYYDLIKIFGDKLQIKTWLQNKLPSDSFSITNALMIELVSQVQAIIVDPQY